MEHTGGVRSIIFTQQHLESGFGPFGLLAPNPVRSQLGAYRRMLMQREMLWRACKTGYKKQNEIN